MIGMFTTALLTAEFGQVWAEYVCHDVTPQLQSLTQKCIALLYNVIQGLIRKCIAALYKIVRRVGSHMRRWIRHRNDVKSNYGGGWMVELT